MNPYSSLPGWVQSRGRVRFGWSNLKNLSEALERAARSNLHKLPLALSHADRASALKHRHSTRGIDPTLRCVASVNSRAASAEPALERGAPERQRRISKAAARPRCAASLSRRHRRARDHAATSTPIGCRYCVLASRYCHSVPAH